MREHWEPGDRAFFEYHCLESPHSSDAPLWYRSHQTVRVIGRGADDALEAPLPERLEAGMPRVYRVRFPDGYEADAVEDELLTHARWFTRPAPPPVPGIRPPAMRLAAQPPRRQLPAAATTRRQASRRRS